jgi:hypothetical protein
MTNTITRRAALGGLASLSATAAAGAALAASPAPESADGPLGLPRATWDAYAGRTAALERLQHHLLAAALTLDEICPADNARWLVVMGGKAGTWRPHFRVERFDTVREPMSDAAQAGIDVEHRTIVHELRARAAS